MSENSIGNLDNHERILKEMHTSYAKQIRTAIPAKIVSFNPILQTATVQIDIEEQIGDAMEKPAELQDVPVSFPRSGGYCITMPLNKGDRVMLVFAHASIDKWCVDGTSNNKDTRTHNISDAIASMVTAYPENDPIENFDNNCLTIRKIGNDIWIKIKNDKVHILGDLVIDGDVEINGDTKVDGTIDATKKIHSDEEVEAMMVKMTTHGHVGVMSGQSKSGLPS